MDDDTYLALADGRRRAVLIALLEESTVPLDALTDAEGNPVGRITLRNQHLPLLEQMGYVSWERAAERVARGPAFDEIRPLVTFHAATVGGSGTEAVATDAGTVD